MSDLDLGPDWIEVRVPEFARMKPGDVIMAMTNNPDLPITVKRRVEPVPPLPRAPWSVIRGTMPSGASLVCILHENGQWWDSSGVAQRDVTRYVGGFEVLAEPRAVIDQRVSDSLTLALAEQRKQTAKAVLGWVQPALPDHWYRDARRTFGVDEDAVSPGVTS